jgi:hypothetical protein
MASRRGNRKQAASQRGKASTTRQRGRGAGTAPARGTASQRPAPTVPLSRTERERDAARKRASRASAKEVVIPPCADRKRRAALEADDMQWLRHYFPDLFWYDFTTQQQAMIRAIREAILYGGDQALAASRGEGKTKICERMLLKYTLCGAIKFSVLFAATGSAAQDSLRSIMDEIESNERLCADYPEVCVPVRALENTPNRAHYQLVSGRRHDTGEPFSRVPSRFSWCGHEIVLPHVPGSPAAGAIIATRGLDAAVRGLNKRNRRVDVACIDDPDTEETANSEEQARKLEQRIDRAIAGLGGQQRSVARVMLTTLQNRRCVSFRFTDPAQKPSWKGKRFRFLITPPKRMDLWDEYIQLRRNNPEDAFGRIAHAFYLAHRAEMDDGAVVANPHRYDPQVLPDGSQLEVSALQRYFNEVARIGQEAVACEYDNDPPEEAGPVESAISPRRIQRQLSGYPRKVVPPECTVITQGIDVKKVALHWVVRAWRPDGTGYTIDYGVYEIHGTTYGSEEGVDVAVQRAILGRMEETRQAQYATVEGEVRPCDLTLVDAGWRTSAVYAACLEAGLGIMPVMGFGRSSGTNSAKFYDVQRRTLDRRPGDGWFLSRHGKLWLVCADADRWKAWEHDRWLTAPGKPGCMYLFGQPGKHPTRLNDDEKAHHSYARHICNEVEVEELVHGVLRRKWKAKSENTHWLDASYYCDVAASIKGIKLLGQSVAKATTTIPRPSGPAAAAAKRQPRSLAELYQQAHRK